MWALAFPRLGCLEMFFMQHGEHKIHVTLRFSLCSLLFTHACFADPILRKVAFAFGFPASFVSLALVKKGSNDVFGIPVGKS